MNGVRANFDFIETGFDGKRAVVGKIHIYSLRSNKPGVTGGLPFHIHEHRVKDGDNSCMSALGHYDPKRVNSNKNNTTYNCDVKIPLSCEEGDLSGKIGNLDECDSDDEYEEHQFIEFVDYSISNFHDLKGRSIVIHNPDKSRLACANIY